MSNSDNNNDNKPLSASAQSMLYATNRANRANAYYYGNLGDSIERRAGTGGYDVLGGGNDYWAGTMGPGNAYQAIGPGNYFGGGLINGFGRMYSGVHSGLGGGGFVHLKRFSSNSSFNHAIVAQCTTAYLEYGIVRNIIDLYADFATEGLVIEHEDKSVRNFYKTWATKVGLKERVHSMFLNLFVSGNVFIHRRWATLQEEEKRAMKRAEASSLIQDSLVVNGKSEDITIHGRESSFIDWYLSKNQSGVGQKKSIAADVPSGSEEITPENNDKKIPWAYTLLNPLQMELRGKKLRGESYWVMAIDKQDTMDIAKGYGLKSSYRVDLGTTQVNLPKEFINRVATYKGNSVGYAAEVKLTKDELSVIQAPGKFDWFDWAVPFVYPALKTLAFKDCLRNMEMRACQSVINSIFLFKLGNIKDGMPASDEDFERLADMLQQPGQTMNILWNDNIKAEVIQADVKGLFDMSKHESADRDILTSLGIPEVLLGGKGGSFSNSYIAVAGVLEKLESARERVISWLMGELKTIADAMGFRKLPEIRFGYTSLQDDKARHSFLLGLYDRNVISADTILQEVNTSVDVEVSKLKEEDSIREENILEPRGPFIKTPPAPAAQGKQPKTANGRPPGTSTGPTGKQSSPRGPVGQGVANILDLNELLNQRGRNILDRLESFCGERLLKARAKENPNLKNLKQLRLEDRERLEQLIYNVFSHMPAAEKDYPDDFISHILNSDAAVKVKSDVLENYTSKIIQYSKTFGKEPTREMRRQFMVSAWTQKAIMDHINQKPNLLSFDLE
jgi:hypothetical protein